jgi:hypothetical protein
MRVAITPWLGRLVAELVAGRAEPTDYPRCADPQRRV